MARIRANGRWTVPGSSGSIANGWKVNTYIAGTSTPKDTYTDANEGTANTNPVILDSRGEATIYWSGIYKVVVTDENDITVWTEDNYGSGEDQVTTGEFNLVKNGSFETDAVTTGEPDNWTIIDYSTGAHSIDNTDQISGLNSLKFTSVGTGGGYATSDYFEVREAKDIFVNWMMRSSVATVRNVVDIIWYTSAKTTISTTNLYDDSTTNPTTWTEKTGQGTPPSTARYAQVRIYGCHSSNTTSGSTWFDDIRIDSAPIAATQAEVDAGIVTDRYVSPATFGSNGVWTPTLQDSSYSDAEGQTYFNNTGTYTKIGNRVFVTGILQVNSLGTLTPADSAYIAGLPFTSSATDYGGLSFTTATSLALATTFTSISGQIFQNSDRFLLRKWDSTPGTNSVTIAEISSGGRLEFFGQYVVSA